MSEAIGTRWWSSQKGVIILCSLVFVSALLGASVHFLRGRGQRFPNYFSPNRSAEEDEIGNLPGLSEPINFRQYSGYLSIAPVQAGFLHYWFVESQSNPAEDPVLLWLNGGPGCSSLKGFFTELGPFKINDDGETLSLRNTSWNKLANVLFLESPFGVGFSYPTYFQQSDHAVALVNSLALENFFDRFPHYRKNALYLSGQSYAGVYLSTLGALLDKKSSLNLKGVAIGNGLFSFHLTGTSLPFFAHDHKLISESAWSKISESCCGGLEPSRKNCQFVFTSATLANSTSGLCSVEHSIYKAFDESGLNPYNIYAQCGENHELYTGTGHFRQRHYDIGIFDEDILTMLRIPSNSSESTTRKPTNEHGTEQRHKHNQGQEDHDKTCFESSLMDHYLNLTAVREAIHIPEEVSRWNKCTHLDYALSNSRQPEGVKPEMLKLLNSKRNLTLLIYDGEVDAVCNHLGNEWFVDDLGRKVLEEKATWTLGDKVVGTVKQLDGLTLVTIQGAGHNVPEDKPKEAFHMIKAFLGAKDRNIEL